MGFTTAIAVVKEFIVFILKIGFVKKWRMVQKNQLWELIPDRISIILKLRKS